MNTERSMSFSRGKGKLTHNDREMIAPNVDTERTPNNVVLVNQSLPDAYNEVFGASQADYNAKQKRKDRKIDDYFEKLFGVSAEDTRATEILTNDNKQQSFYEWVIGIGSAYDTAIVDWETESGKPISANPQAAKLATECLREYIEGNESIGVPSFAERNPNFYVFQAFIHLDEKTPHLHFDAIPYSDGYKRGMTRQQGIAKALEAMGYGIGETAIAQWQEKERAVLRKISESHGFKIRDEQKSRGYTVLTRQYGEYKENELALEEQQAQIEERKEEIEMLRGQAEQHRKQLQETIEKMQERESRLQQQALAYEFEPKGKFELQSHYNARKELHEVQVGLKHAGAEQARREQNFASENEAFEEYKRREQQKLSEEAERLALIEKTLDEEIEYRAAEIAGEIAKKEIKDAEEKIRSLRISNDFSSSRIKNLEKELSEERNERYEYITSKPTSESILNRNIDSKWHLYKDKLRGDYVIFSDYGDILGSIEARLDDADDFQSYDNIDPPQIYRGRGR